MSELIFDQSARGRINKFLSKQPGNVARLFMNCTNEGEEATPLLGSYDKGTVVSGAWIEMEAGCLFISEAAAKQFGASIITLVVKEHSGNRITQFGLRPR